MNLPTRALPPLGFLPLFLAAATAGDKPTFQPKSGSTVVKHISIESEVELEDLKMEVNGQDMSEAAGQIEMAMKIHLQLDTTDQYVAVEGGRPTKLKRTFDALSSTTHVSGSNPMAGPTDKDIALESELEGLAVVFSWDADSSSYDVAFDGEKQGDEALLEGLEEDLDLRNFLPSSEVSKGDTWEIPAAAIKAVLAPGGNLKLLPSDDSDSSSGAEQFSPNDMIGDLEGEFVGTLGDTREEDGVKVAVIQIKIKGHSAKDMTATI